MSWALSVSVFVSVSLCGSGFLFLQLLEQNSVLLQLSKWKMYLSVERTSYSLCLVLMLWETRQGFISEKN